MNRLYNLHVQRAPTLSLSTSLSTTSASILSSPPRTVSAVWLTQEKGEEGKRRVTSYFDHFTHMLWPSGCCSVHPDRFALSFAHLTQPKGDPHVAEVIGTWADFTGPEGKCWLRALCTTRGSQLWSFKYFDNMETWKVVFLLDQEHAARPKTERKCASCSITFGHFFLVFFYLSFSDGSKIYWAAYWSWCPYIKRLHTL